MNDATQLKRKYAFIGDGDIYKNYNWAIRSNTQTFIDEVPRIVLKEYGLKETRTIAQAKAAFDTFTVGAQNMGIDIGSYIDNNNNNVKESLSTYIKSLYSTTGILNSYSLPYFSDYNHIIRNNWIDSHPIMNVTDELKSIFKATASTFFGYGSIVKRKVWDETQSETYSFKFTLYNTYEEGDIAKNFNFVRGLINNNLAERSGIFTLMPPVIYEVSVPGIRYSPAAYISRLNIGNIGQINRKQFDIPKTTYIETLEESMSMDTINRSNGETTSVEMNIPDGWEIDITLTELIPETANIFSAGLDNDLDKVRVISKGEGTVTGTMINDTMRAIKNNINPSSESSG